MEANTVKDVVCGMTVDRAKAAASAEHAGTRYHFCSEHCRDKFLASPETYVKSESEGGSEGEPHGCC